MDADRRRAWLFPPVRGWFDGVDLGLLDPADDGDRQVLIKAEHPEFAEAIDDDHDEVDLEGRAVSPRLHLLMHELVANQIWGDDPPEVWTTAERLTAEGFERHDVLHMLGSVAAGELWHVVKGQSDVDRGRYVGALDALPGPWAESDDEGWDEGSLPSGTILTHRMTGPELAGGFVAYEPDLEALDPLLAACGHLHLTGDTVAEFDIDDDGNEILVGGDGWLPAVRPGDLVGFRVIGDEVELVVVTDALAPDRLVEPLGAAFDRLNSGDGMPVQVGELIASLAAGSSDLAVALPPAGELLAAGGFEVRDGYAAPLGADWDTFGHVRSVAATALVHGLDREEAQALVMVASLFRLFAQGELTAEGAGDGVFEEVAPVLSESSMAEAFVNWAMSGTDADALGRFADMVRAQAPRRLRAGPAWVTAWVAGQAGTHDRAEALLREAIDADRGFGPALDDAAWYASDRGDARRAVDLLRRVAELRTDARVAEAQIDMLVPYSAPPRALARRNDPCPCGSGRKYKLCHLHQTDAMALADRVEWIWGKLDWFLRRGRYSDRLDEVVMALGSDAPQDELLAASLLLFRDGVVADFLRLRGPLLPDDERSLVGRWAAVDRSVHEVVAVDPGAGVTLRDVRTGEVVEVRERLGSRQMAGGDLVCAHVVPDGAGYQLVGGVVPVPPSLCDRLVASLDDDGAGAAQVAAVIAGVAAPPAGPGSTTRGSEVR